MENELVYDVDDTADANPSREVYIEGIRWIARHAGHTAAGSGSLGLGYLECVDFALAEDPETSIREALVQRGRFARMFDEEIIALFNTSHPVTQQVAVRRSLEDSH